MRSIESAVNDPNPFRATVNPLATPVDAYCAPAWLVGGHAQTIYPFFLARPHVRYRRERVDTPDGDFWDLDWLDAPDAPRQARCRPWSCSTGSRAAPARTTPAR